MLTFKRPHYAWVICFAGALALFTALGLGVNVLSFFIQDIKTQEGFSEAQGSLLLTIRNLSSLLSMLVVNNLCRRFGPRPLLLVGNLLVFACYVGFSLSNSFLAYCCCTVLMGLGYTFGGSVPVAFIFARWFESRRSFAMGTAAATSGLALLIMPPILTGMIESLSLDATFLIHAGLCLLLAISSFLLLRNTPEEISKEPYRGAESKKNSAAPRQPVELPRLSHLQNALFLFVAVLAGGPIGVGYTHIKQLLYAEHYDPMLVATIFSFMGLVLMIAKSLTADLYDRIGGWKGNFVIFGSATVGLALLLLSPTGNVPIVFVAIAFYSFGLSSGSISTYQWSADLFGTAGYADGVRSFNMAYTLGALAFGPVPGILADLHPEGSYIPAFSLFLVIFIVAFVLLQGLYHKLGLHKR